MGFISFQKLCLVLFLISLSCYYISAFRLILPPQQTQETKVKPELKESVKKLDEIKDEIMSFKDKYRNQTFKLQQKYSESDDRPKTRIISEKKVKPVQPTPPDISEENISESEEHVKTRIISEKKVKSVESTLLDITKEKILRAKTAKLDILDESSEEETLKLERAKTKIISEKKLKPVQPNLLDITKEKILKSIKSEISDESSEEEPKHVLEDRIKTRIISDKKIKPVQPILLDITKEKILNAKLGKSDITKESSEEEEQPNIVLEDRVKTRIISDKKIKPVQPITKEKILKAKSTKSEISDESSEEEQPNLVIDDRIKTKIISDKKIKPILPVITKEKLLSAKSIKSHITEESTEEDKPKHELDDRVKTRIISDKKIKPVQPILPVITKEKILSAKSTKSHITDESTEEDKPKVVLGDRAKTKIISEKKIKPVEPILPLPVITKEKILSAKFVKSAISDESSEEEKPKLKPEKIIKIEPPKIDKNEGPIKKIEKSPVQKEEKVETKKQKVEKKTETIKPIEEKKIEMKKPKEEIKAETKKLIDTKKPKEEKKIETPKPKEEKKTKPKTADEQVTSKQTKETVQKEQTKPAKTEELQPARIKRDFDVSITSLYFNLPSFSPNFDIVESEECKIQGHILIDQLNKHKIWAMKMFDATAKIPSGILKGNLNQLGDYDQCVGIFTKIPIDDHAESDVKIAGKYCLANIDFEAEIQEMKLPVHLAQSRAMIRSKIQDPGHFIPLFTTIRWGLCIPSGCTAEDAERILEDSLKTYNESLNIGIKFDVSIGTDQCHVRKAPKKWLDYHITTLATLGLTVAIGLLVLVSTLRDVRLLETGNSDEVKAEKQESSKMEKMLMSFSLKRTVASLLRQTSDPDDIECIHGIRTICTFILYIAHKLMPMGHVPYTNKTVLTEVSNNPLSIILRLSVIYTDTFLLLSGILISYGMSKDMEEKGRIPWFKRFVARFVRLTPPLLFILLYYAYVMDILGEGPLWDTVMTSNAKICKESWWRNVLYIQNFYPFQEMCATHTHQLALDMQLSLIAPILVWLLYRRPLLGVTITILLHSISVILRYYATMNYRLSLVIYHGISISQLYRTANVLYASSIHRATPYIAGIGLGVLLRQIKPNFVMPKILLFIGWIIAGYFASWALYTPSHLSSRTYKYDINEAAQFAALCSLAWALALSWLIFSCFADKQGFLNSFLSSRPMVVLSRISYTLYLTQFIVFFYNVGTLRSSPEFKIHTSLDLIELTIILVISTLLTLLVDMPVQQIKCILLKPSTKSEESEISRTTDNIEHFSNKIGKTSDNVKRVTISETVEILDDNEDIEMNHKYRQLSTESEPTSEPLTEDIEEMYDDEDIVEHLEHKMRQFSTESETYTEENDDEIAETSENKYRQSSFESQTSMDDVEEIDDEAIVDDLENRIRQESIESQQSAEDVEEILEDDAGAVEKFVFNIRLPPTKREHTEQKKDEKVVKKLGNNIRQFSTESEPDEEE